MLYSFIMTAIEDVWVGLGVSRRFTSRADGWTCRGNVGVRKRCENHSAYSVRPTGKTFREHPSAYIVPPPRPLFPYVVFVADRFAGTAMSPSRWATATVLYLGPRYRHAGMRSKHRPPRSTRRRNRPRPRASRNGSRPTTRRHTRSSSPLEERLGRRPVRSVAGRRGRRRVGRVTDAGGTVLVVVVGPAAGRLLRVVRATGRRAGRLSARHEVRFARYDAIVRRVLRFRVAVLRVIELLAHHVVQRAAPEVQYLLERPPEVPVQRRVYHLRHTRVGHVVLGPAAHTRNHRGVSR